MKVVVKCKYCKARMEIELDYYKENVRSNIFQMIMKLKEDGRNICDECHIAGREDE